MHCVPCQGTQTQHTFFTPFYSTRCILAFFCIFNFDCWQTLLLCVHRVLSKWMCKKLTAWINVESNHSSNSSNSFGQMFYGRQLHMCECKTKKKGWMHAAQSFNEINSKVSQFENKMFKCVCAWVFVHIPFFVAIERKLLFIQNEQIIQHQYQYHENENYNHINNIIAMPIAHTLGWNFFNKIWWPIQKRCILVRKFRIRFHFYFSSN